MPPEAGASWRNCGFTGALVLLAVCLAAEAGFALVWDGRGWVIPGALAAGALIWALSWLGGRYIAFPERAWSLLAGTAVPVAMIPLAALAVCWPTLNSYFSGDEFAYIPLFRDMSLGQFWRLFHSDLSQGVLGWNPRELRPLYGLSFRLSYLFWGVRPLGYHLTSVLVHIGNSVMVFLIARRMASGRSWRAGFAGLLYAVQPVHSWTISWANGSLTEAVPALFYLAAFLFFVAYRDTRLVRYFAMSVVAFATCLFSKATAVTLPVMLVAYDLFRALVGASRDTGISGEGKLKARVRAAVAYIPFAALLGVYLGLRRIAFTSLLPDEQMWANVQQAAASATGFWLHFLHLLRHLSEIQLFNIRQLMLNLPSIELGVVLGIYLVAICALLRRKTEGSKSIEVVVFFGLIWYLITNLPLLATYEDAHHLYLPAVGPCIAAAFLLAPPGEGIRRNRGYLRLLGAILLVIFCAVQLWKEDAQWARKAEVSRIGTAQLATVAARMLNREMVVVWFPSEASATESWDENLPYSLQEPFQSADLYARADIVEDPDIYCCPVDHWWAKTKPMLRGELAGPADGQVEVELLAWDKGSSSFRTWTRILSRGALRQLVNRGLGEPLEHAEDIDDPQAKMLVSQLEGLVAASP
jgi:hypothetical protein